MKRYIALLGLLMAIAPCLSKSDSNIVMVVDGEPIDKTEFEYFLRKNYTDDKPLNNKTLREYSDLYLNFKLKVAAAKRAGYDTIQTFLDEYQEYRSYQAEAYMVDSAYLESLAKQTYEASRREVGENGIINLGILTITPKDNTEESVNIARMRSDSIYEQIIEGANFHDMAARYSTDGAARNGGIIGWVSESQLPPFVAERAFSMSVGEVMPPFISEMGVMMLYLIEKQDFGEYEDHRSSIYEWMDRQGFNQLAIREKASKLAKEYGWENISADEAVARMDSLLEKIYPEFAAISREYYEGLLMFEISNRELWQRVDSDSIEIENYFLSHRKEYKFSTPRFKGLLLFCKSKQVFDDIKALLVGVDESEWIPKISAYNSENQSVRLLRGPIEKGNNQYVDYIVFGEGEYQPREDFPYVDVLGEAIYEPQYLSDVYSDVIADYQNYLDREWIGRLRKEIPYKVYRSTLKQVSLNP